MYHIEILNFPLRGAILSLLAQRKNAKNYSHERAVLRLCEPIEGPTKSECRFAFAAQAYPPASITQSGRNQGQATSIPHISWITFSLACVGNDKWVCWDPNFIGQIE